MIRALLEAGADPHALTDDGTSPLHAAAISGKPAAVNLLISAGADPNGPTDAPRTPLHHAIRNPRLAWSRTGGIRSGHPELSRCLTRAPIRMCAPRKATRPCTCSHRGEDSTLPWYPGSCGTGRLWTPGITRAKRRCTWPAHAIASRPFGSSWNSAPTRSSRQRRKGRRSCLLLGPGGHHQRRCMEFPCPVTGRERAGLPGERDSRGRARRGGRNFPGKDDLGAGLLRRLRECPFRVCGCGRGR